MGGEFAQEREWNHDQSLDWHLLDDPLHRGVAGAGPRPQPRSTASMPALHERDCEPAGFEWIDGDDADNSVLAFVRYGGDGDAPVARRLQLHAGRARRTTASACRAPGRWSERLNTDAGDLWRLRCRQCRRGSRPKPVAVARPAALGRR